MKWEIKWEKNKINKTKNSLAMTFFLSFRFNVNVTFRAWSYQPHNSKSTLFFRYSFQIVSVVHTHTHTHTYTVCTVFNCFTIHRFSDVKMMNMQMLLYMHYVIIYSSSINITVLKKKGNIFLESTRTGTRLKKKSLLSVVVQLHDCLIQSKERKNYPVNEIVSHSQISFNARKRLSYHFVFITVLTPCPIFQLLYIIIYFI